MRLANGCGLMLVLLVAGINSAGSQTQSYPSKPIHIHAPNPGSGADVAARVIAPELRSALGQPVVVENFNSTVLASGIAKAVPDGHTLMFQGAPLWVTPLLQDMPYDTIRDFAPIAPLTLTPTLLVVNPSLPVRSVKELVALAKAQPGKLNYASAVTGTSSHLAGELFKAMANIDFVLIKYKGGASQSTLDVVSGAMDLTIGPAPNFAPLVEAGKLRALATGGASPSKLFPNFPTVAETLPGYLAESLFAAFAPGKTPEAIVRRLNQEMLRALDKPEVRNRLLKSGYEINGGTPEELADYIKADMARVGKVIKDVGIKAD